jgi:hypothetical protein
MNNRIVLVTIVAVMALTACDKGDNDNQADKDAAISNKIGDVSHIPRIKVTPDKKKEEG